MLVTGSNSIGSASAASSPTAVVQAVQGAPQNTAPPSISGTAREGQTLQAAVGTWTGNPPPTFSYQWEKCDQTGQNCTPIQGATNSTYTLRFGEVGATIRVSVTATNSAGSAQASSAPTIVVTSAAGPVTPLLDDFNRSNNSGPPSSQWSRMPFAALGHDGEPVHLVQPRSGGHQHLDRLLEREPVRPGHRGVGDGRDQAGGR